LLTLFADIVSLEENIDRAVEAVSVRDIPAINPALVAELFDGEWEQFLIDLEAEVNLSARRTLPSSFYRLFDIGSYKK